MTIRTTVAAAGMLFAANLFGATATDSTWIRGVTDKDPITYKAGEEVELIFDLVASDTDYTFYLDGKSEGLDVHGTGNSFIIRFTMPDHDIKLNYSEKNSMEYQPDGKADFRF